MRVEGVSNDWWHLESNEASSNPNLNPNPRLPLTLTPNGGTFNQIRSPQKNLEDRIRKFGLRLLYFLSLDQTQQLLSFRLKIRHTDATWHILECGVVGWPPPYPTQF